VYLGVERGEGSVSWVAERKGVCVGLLRECIKGKRVCESIERDC